MISNIIYIAGDRKIDLGFKNIESITIEIRTETDRLCFTEVYKPPSMKHDVFKTDFSNTCENLLSRYDNLFILGDLFTVQFTCTAIQL
jgi:hypothetical protein